MSNEFEQLAPRGPIKGPGDQWDVFLSYRSASRPWVLRLYDYLRHLGYEVFMDQFVLTTSDSLTDQLGDNLKKSATAVLIWSARSEESEWCQREQKALMALENKKSEFRYVVLKIDNAELPLFEDDKLWIDFSQQPDGPSGTDLLRLLYGLRGQPLSEAAVKEAARHDEAVRHAQARIGSARNSGDADELLALGQSTDPVWTASPMLPCKVAESLIALKQPDKAVPLLDQVKERFPRSIRLRQLKGLALARMGSWREAQRVLGELHELGERDPETLGILARTWRDRYAQSGDRLHLRKARNLYVEAFEDTPSDYYTGINAASNSVLLGELEVAEKYAAAVERLLGTEPRSGDYWATATVAEVQLIRRRYAEAARLYATAVEDDPEAKSNHDSTRQQARRLMDALAPSPEERESIEKAFG